MIYTALIVADEILKAAKRKGLSLTPMQLTKLTYIAHGWSLAVLGRDLFKDRIEAWKYGPVIPVLYQATKKYGRNPIPADLIEVNAQSRVDSVVESFIADVVDKYGHLTGVQLSSLTHQPGTPWSNRYRDGVMHIEIEDELIKEHYVRKLNDYRGASA